MSLLINQYRFVAAASDPNFANVVALLHFDGADGSTVFTDVKGKTWTRTDTAAIDTSQSVFGGASLEDPTVNSALGTVSHADFGYGTADFTIEFWFRIAVLGGTRIIYDQRTTGTQAVPTIYFASTTLNYFTSGAIRISSPTGWAINTWYHLAVSRVSGTTRMFRNGVQVGSNYTDATNYITSRVLLGDAGDAPGSGAGFTGWLDDLRVTKGVGRYSSNFTPPAAAFPDS